MKQLFTRSKTLLFVIVALITGANTAWADEVTVYNNADYSSDYVPFSGYDADSQQRDQMIFPSEVLESLVGKEITSMKFYYKKNETAGTNVGNWIVSLGLTEATTLSALDTTTPLTQVFSGAITPNTSDLTITITFDEGYFYSGGNLLVDFNHPQASGYKKFTFWCSYITPAPAFTKGAQRTYLPKTTFTYEDVVSDGPALVVKDGSKITSPYSYNFGLATAGTEKTFTLSNPGTEDLDVSVSETGGFGATLSETTIVAGGEVTLTLTMPVASGNSEVTITPASGSGIDPFVINVSGTIRDANKVYEYGFTALPEDWATTGSWYYSEANGAYTTVWYLSSNARLITPQLVISEGEKFYVEAKGYSTSNTSYQHLQMQYSADKNTWTNFDSEPVLDPSNWSTFEFTGAPAGKYYIAINASQADIRMFYGGALPQDPKMVVTQPASLDYGIITEATAKTFTIANTGRATLEGINVVSSNSGIFSITGAPTSLNPGASAEVTITMATSTTGALSSDITVSATGMEDVTFTVTGVVMPEGLSVVDFNDNQLPAGWGNNASNKWSFVDGKAYCTNAAELTTPKLQFSANALVVIKVSSYDNYDNNYIEITGSADGTTWNEFTAKKYVSRSQIPYGSYTTLAITGIPTTTKYLKFKGYYVYVDEIAGLTYAPDLAVTMNGETVTSPASYDFGEKLTKDETVTYNFANKGAGTIDITGVSISGDGADAYTTNWTESKKAPFDLEITRTYDGTRTGVQEAVVTVTTSEGDFVINVSGSDQGLNAPELSIDATPIDFGKLAANDTKTITVTNAGTGLLTVNIESDNALFTVSPAQLTDIATGESKTFEVTFNYDNVAGNYGEKTANITVTPTYDESANVIISATAKAKNPSVWSEEFTDDPTVDRGWTADTGWNFTDGKAVGGGSGYLTSPWLTVTGESDELVFDYEGTTSTSTFGTYVYYAVRKYGEEWPSNSYLSELVKPDTKGTYTITGLEAGTYQIRFKYGSYALDNFEGFTRFIPAHDAEITSVNIPTTGYVGREFTATVTVTEKLGKDENATAKLYINGAEMVTATQALTPNDATEIELAFTPDAEVSYKAAYIEITYDGGTLTGETKYVTIEPVYEYAENQTNEITTGNMLAVVLKRSFIQGWNTICVPFGISSPKSYFGDDVKVYTFDSYSSTDGLSFKAINLSNGMDAGVPYLAYIPSAVGSELFFENVSVSATMHDVTKGDVTFTGTYSPITAGSLTDNYVLTTEAKIAKAGASASMKAFRAYFIAPAEARMTISFDDNTTGIGVITTDGELEVGTLYNLKGQKVQGTQKGLYIINGKKVVVK